MRPAGANNSAAVMAVVKDSSLLVCNGFYEIARLIDVQAAL